MSRPQALRGSVVVAALATAVFTLAAAQAVAQPDPAMSFFVTSQGNGPNGSNGGDHGGLDGADARCQALATAVGAGSGRIWHAYLSTAPIAGVPGGLVHARDRIGSGPWVNWAGEVVATSVATLHANGIHRSRMLDENGATVPANEHDILTGSNPDGTAKLDFPDNPTAPPPNCWNWTDGTGAAWGWVGHVDWIPEANPADSWNSRHPSQCSQAGLNGNGGAGRLYCFALVDVDPLDDDGFEGGDTGGWDFPVP